jgi:2',3'-cyclic-nucleotide 2'-phosphodiesterase (5'-nucleotidase family)
MIKLISIFLLLIALFLEAAESSKKEIVLLHTNDIESVYDPVPAVWRADMELIGGISHLATLIRDVRAKENISFLVDAGDIFTGALSKKSEGKLPFDLYSAMNYDVLTLGNHEFEYGWETLVETIPRANFPVLNANIVREASGTLIAEPYTILKKNGIKVGVIGVMGIDAFYNTMASFHRTGLTIKDPTETVQYWADKIRDDVNMIIVLTHQNKTAPMQTNKESDPSVQRGFDEDYAMAGNLKGVDVIFGGHSDNGLQTPVIHPKTGTVIGLTFGQGMHLGYTKFQIDTQKYDVEFIEGFLIPVNSNELPEDKETSTLINNYRKVFPELLEVIGNVSEPLMRKYNKESTIGNLLTDYIKEAAGSDIAFLNSGAIRADFNAGDITLEQLINVYPFKDNLTTIELSGSQIKELIEYSLTLPYGIGQISGLEIKYDSLQDEMNRLIEIKINGSDLMDIKKYSVSVSGYLANGGDGYQILSKGRVLSNDKPFQDALYDEFKKVKIIQIPTLGRQINVSDLTKT